MIYHLILIGHEIHSSKPLLTFSPHLGENPRKTTNVTYYFFSISYDLFSDNWYDLLKKGLYIWCHGEKEHPIMHLPKCFISNPLSMNKIAFSCIRDNKSLAYLLMK